MLHLCVLEKHKRMIVLVRITTVLGHSALLGLPTEPIRLLTHCNVDVQKAMEQRYTALAEEQGRLAAENQRLTSEHEQLAKVSLAMSSSLDSTGSGVMRACAMLADCNTRACGRCCHCTLLTSPATLHRCRIYALQP